MNDIEKINALQCYKGNPSKTRQIQKNQKLKIIRKKASQAWWNFKVDSCMIWKKSYLEGDFEFLHPDPQLDQNFKPTRFVRTYFDYI